MSERDLQRDLTSIFTVRYPPQLVALCSYSSCQLQLLLVEQGFLTPGPDRDLEAVTHPSGPQAAACLPPVSTLVTMAQVRTDERVAEILSVRSNGASVEVWKCEVP